MSYVGVGVLTLSHGYNAVRGHTTSSNNSMPVPVSNVISVLGTW